jgi:D-arabinose 1-dehydrogenase-like Zn-dependent alcohol dehydrogenase
LKRKDFQEVARLAWAQEVPSSNLGAPTKTTLLLSYNSQHNRSPYFTREIRQALFPRVSREQTLHGSFWGNNADLSEVMALAAQDKIRHTVKTFSFEQINQYLELLRAGEIVGRAVMNF